MHNSEIEAVGFDEITAWNVFHMHSAMKTISKHVIKIRMYPNPVPDSLLPNTYGVLT